MALSLHVMQLSPSEQVAHSCLHALQLGSCSSPVAAAPQWAPVRESREPAVERLGSPVRPVRPVTMNQQWELLLIY
jgi:hypothetical protein